MDLDLWIFLAALVTALSGLFAFLRWGKGFGASMSRKLRARRTNAVPSKTILIVPHQYRKPWWHMGAEAGNPAMQITCDLYVTNITEREIHLVGARLRNPDDEGTVHALGGGVVATIPAGGTAEVMTDFWVNPAVLEKGRELRADVALRDQYGNEHWIKGVRFEYQ